MTARQSLLVAHTGIAGALGVATLLAWFGLTEALRVELLWLLLMFVLPAMIAAALATRMVGRRGLESAALGRSRPLALALRTTLTAFALYLPLVALVVWPWTLLLTDETPGGVADVLMQGMLVAVVAMVVVLLAGLLPAIALSWWVWVRAVRRRRLELALQS